MAMVGTGFSKLFIMSEDFNCCEIKNYKILCGTVKKPCLGQAVLSFCKILPINEKNYLLTTTAVRKLIGKMPLY